jgi:threonine/homoserine/homoserine lactone efflux protein
MAMPDLAAASSLAAAVRWAAAGPLLLSSLAVMGSPGPATISLTAAGSAYGLRRSARYLAGITAGTTIVLLAVASGVTATLLAVPGLRAVLIVASAAYILWLAYRIATAPPLPAQQAAAQAPSFTGGLFLGVANPKAWVAIAAVFASSRLASTAVTDATAKVAVLTAMIVLIMVSWLTAGATLAPLLRHPVGSRVINAALAAGLIGATAMAVIH